MALEDGLEGNLGALLTSTLYERTIISATPLSHKYVVFNREYRDNKDVMENFQPPKFDEKRTAQAAAFLLFHANGPLPLIKLLKLLYLAERLSLSRYGEPITGDSIVAMEHGPVLSATLNHINGALHSDDGGWNTWVSDRENHNVALRDPSMIRSPDQDLLKLSDADLEVLQEIWAKFGHWDRWDLVRYTHSSNVPEWNDPGQSSSPITYPALLPLLGHSEEHTEYLLNRISSQSHLNKTINNTKA